MSSSSSDVAALAAAAAAAASAVPVVEAGPASTAVKLQDVNWLTGLLLRGGKRPPRRAIAVVIGIRIAALHVTATQALTALCHNDKHVLQVHLHENVRPIEAQRRRTCCAAHALDLLCFFSLII
jgi:hypothetical protein